MLVLAVAADCETSVSLPAEKINSARCEARRRQKRRNLRSGETAMQMLLLYFRDGQAPRTVRAV